MLAAFLRQSSRPNATLPAAAVFLAAAKHLWPREKNARSPLRRQFLRRMRRCRRAIRRALNVRRDRLRSTTANLPARKITWPRASSVAELRGRFYDNYVFLRIFWHEVRQHHAPSVMGPAMTAFGPLAISQLGVQTTRPSLPAPSLDLSHLRRGSSLRRTPHFATIESPLPTRAFLSRLYGAACAKSLISSSDKARS